MAECTWQQQLLTRSCIRELSKDEGFEWLVEISPGDVDRRDIELRRGRFATVTHCRGPLEALRLLSDLFQQKKFSQLIICLQ